MLKTHFSCALIILLTCNLLSVVGQCRAPLKFYNDLKCIPIYDYKINTQCPIQYDCSHLIEHGAYANSSNQCYYDGNWYSVDEYIEVPNVCEINVCRCASNLNFECTSKRCPNYALPEGDNCYLAYEIDKCCPIKAYCDKDYYALISCNVGGTVYMESELFNPPVDKCKICVCNKYLTGAFAERNCASKPCQVQVFQSGEITKFCAPVYISKGDCCPVDFICPNENDINALVGLAGTKNDLRCRYGEVYVKKDIELTRTLDNYGSITITICSCVMPPFMTCYRYYY